MVDLGWIVVRPRWEITYCVARALSPVVDHRQKSLDGPRLSSIQSCDHDNDSVVVSPLTAVTMNSRDVVARGFQQKDESGSMGQDSTNSHHAAQVAQPPSTDNSNKNNNNATSTTSTKLASANEVVAANNNTDVPYWERLPSQNLSFGSAEILTVDECILHGVLYCQRAIRVTGLLHKRSVQDDTIILELKNPLSSGNAPSSLSPSSSNIYNSNSSNSSSRKRPPGSASKLLRKRQRPWFATSSCNNNNNNNNNKTSALATSTPTKKSPVMLRKKTTTPTITILKVTVDPRLKHVSTLVEGSLVMVIGTMIRPKDCTIEARLLQNVTSTDMTFYTNALKMRRKYLYNRYKVSQGTEKIGDDPGLLQGCGPPPYERLETK